MDHKTNIHELKELIKEFCEKRDWDQYHAPKELAIGISTEAAELLEIFRFKDEKQQKELFENPKIKEHIEEEVADTFYFILRFCQMNNINLTEVLMKKLEKNNEKYPIDKIKGSNKKYTELEE